MVRWVYAVFIMFPWLFWRFRRNFDTSSLQLFCQGQLWALLAQLTTIINPNCPYIVKAFDQNGNIVGMCHQPGLCLMMVEWGWAERGEIPIWSFQELNLIWLNFSNFHGLFRFIGIDYGLGGTVSPIQDDSQRINMFIFGVQREFEHVQSVRPCYSLHVKNWIHLCCHGVPSPKKWQPEVCWPYMTWMLYLEKLVNNWQTGEVYEFAALSEGVFRDLRNWCWWFFWG